MFFLFGPQAPTAFSNGPTTIHLQAVWIEKAMQYIQKDGIERFEATDEAEAEWTRRVGEEWYATLFPKAKSWYQGANIPGRRVEPLNWVGGLPEYVRTLDRSLENNAAGWKVTPAVLA